MSDRTFDIGDVVYDLAQGSKMQIVGRAAARVDEYSQREDYDLASYKCHPQLGVSPSEPVFTCVYLPDSLKSSVSGTYDFPASRLARCPVEDANEDLQRIHAEKRDEFLATLAEASVMVGLEEEAAEVVDRAFGCRVSQLFEELQDAEKLGRDDGDPYVCPKCRHEHVDEDPETESAGPAPGDLRITCVECGFTDEQVQSRGDPAMEQRERGGRDV